MRPPVNITANYIMHTGAGRVSAGLLSTPKSQPFQDPGPVLRTASAGAARQAAAPCALPRSGLEPPFPETDRTGTSLYSVLVWKGPRDWGGVVLML